jgi:hypothetical protein
LFLHGAEDLAAVLEGLGVGDFEFDSEFGDRHFSADECEVEGHSDADRGKDETEDYGVAGDAAGLPGTGAKLLNELDVAEGRDEVDDDAECDKTNSGPKGEAVAACGDVGFGGADLAKKEAEAADSEANTHEAEASADPGEEGSLGGEVYSGVLFGRLVHAGIV